MKTTQPDPLDWQEGDLDNDGDTNSGLPASLWAEYDSAADWCAARGLKGEIGCELPHGLSAKAGRLIDADPEAFERRVREHAYFRAMTGPRQVRIVKGGEQCEEEPQQEHEGQERPRVTREMALDAGDPSLEGQHL